MADNTSTKVLTIDTGNAISNVRDFKAKIEELKGALLGLENGTEEYNAVAQELRNSQQKLTEVMDVARGKAEGVQGSYDNLVATMRQLKQEWRATADETTRTNLGSQILDINNQLKELDASTGNFQRNVGDYANAFENAFRAVIGGIGRFNPELAKTAATVGSLIPVIKQTATVATASLQGIKKAIVSTGIGALVVAVGLVAANWEKVSNAIRNATKSGREYNETMKSINDAKELSHQLAQGLTDEQRYQLQLLEAQGTSRAKLLEVEKVDLETNIQITENLLTQAKATRDAAKAAMDAANEEAKNVDPSTQLFKSIKLGNEYNRQKKIWEESSASIATITGDLDTQKKSLDIITAKIKTLNETINVSKTSSSDTVDSYKKQAQDLLKALEDAHKSQFEKEEQQYKDNLVLLKNYFDTEKDAYDKQLKAKKISQTKYNEAIQKLTEEYQYGVDELTRNWHRRQLEMQDEQNEETLNLIAENAAKERQLLVSETEKTIKELKDKTKRNVIELQLKYKKEDLQSQIDAGGKVNTDTLSKQVVNEGFEKQEKRLNEIYSTKKAALDIEKESLQELLGQLTKNTNEYISTQERIKGVEMELSDLATQNEIENLELQKEKTEELKDVQLNRINTVEGGLQSLGSLISSIGDIMEEQINTEVENGDISEEMAKKRFESVKAMQIAATVINTIAGAIGAFMQASSTYPAPYGQIIGGVTAAAVTAAGLVQISQIKRQKYGSDSSGSISTPNLQRASMPTQIQPVQNVTGQDEITELSNAINSKPVIVKVTDIDDVNQIKDSTIAESTF